MQPWLVSDLEASPALSWHLFPPETTQGMCCLHEWQDSLVIGAKAEQPDNGQTTGVTCWLPHFRDGWLWQVSVSTVAPVSSWEKRFNNKVG